MVEKMVQGEGWTEGLPIHFGRLAAA